MDLMDSTTLPQGFCRLLRRKAHLHQLRGILRNLNLCCRCLQIQKKSKIQMKISIQTLICAITILLSYHRRTQMFLRFFVSFFIRIFPQEGLGEMSANSQYVRFVGCSFIPLGDAVFSYSFFEWNRFPFLIRNRAWTRLGNSTRFVKPTAF